MTKHKGEQMSLTLRALRADEQEVVFHFLTFAARMPEGVSQLRLRAPSLA
jgi:hypothetical protein